MLDIVEHADAVHHLESRLEADEKAARGTADLDRAKRDTFDHGRNLTELVRRIDLNLETPAGPRIDAGLPRLQELVGNIVDGHERYLHRVRLGVRRCRQQTSRHDAGKDSSAPAENRVHGVPPEHARRT
jgi:hypothetical protein